MCGASVKTCVRLFKRACSRGSRSHHLCPDVAQAAQTVGRPSDGPPLLIDGGIAETEEEERAAGSTARSAADRPANRPAGREKNGSWRSQVPSRQIWAREELERLSNMWKSARAPFDFCRPDAARISRQIPSDSNSQRTERR